MNRAIRVSTLAIRHSGILLSTLMWLIIVRIGLSTASHKQLRKLFLPHEAFEASVGGELRHVVWAVSRVSPFVPFASCLTQALAAQIILARRHVSTTLHLGVTVAGGAGEFAAHAWLEKDGMILLGGPRTRILGFVPLAAYGPIAE